MKIKKLFILGISTLLLTGCFFKRDSMENIDIYTTIYPIIYLTTYLYGGYSKAYIKETLKDSEYKTIVTDSDELKFLENLLTDKSFTVISLDKTDEINITYTVKDNDTLDTIAKENSITKDSIIKLNNLETDKITTGQKLDLTIKTVSNNNIAKAKKLIADKKIKYIYTTSDINSEIVKELTSDYDIEVIKINNMSTIDGGVTNTNENYLTIMNSNIELLRKELYK